MAETAKAEAMFEHWSEDSPILFEDGRVRVFKNPTNEIFVRDIESGATMRINSCFYPGGGLQFTAYGLVVEPIQINNGIGWRVGPR